MLESFYQSIIKDAKKLEHHAKQTTNKNKIVSQSDIGFHNTIKDREKLYFIDFEYAGIDDSYKLVSDLLVHPDWIANEQVIQEIGKRLIPKLFKSEPFDLEYFLTIAKIHQFKWITIIES